MVIYLNTTLVNGMTLRQQKKGNFTYNYVVIVTENIIVTFYLSVQTEVLRLRKRNGQGKLTAVMQNISVIALT